MFFSVVPYEFTMPKTAKSRCFLTEDNWNDFGYRTLYRLNVFDSKGERHSVGTVKIGQFGMNRNQFSPILPRSFDKLENNFFSLGQDDSYYDLLNALGPQLRSRVLVGLRDVALDQQLFVRALLEPVTKTSLLRSITPTTVTDQFHRLARGGARLSKYELRYTAPWRVGSRFRPISLSFLVEPESQPPTNIHVLIGRNAVGKTRTLNQMIRALVDEEASPRSVGKFQGESDGILDADWFPSLVSVAFSAFDPFVQLSLPRDDSEGVRYTYIGLNPRRKALNERRVAPKDLNQLTRDFSQSIWLCSQESRVERWLRAIGTLRADPSFADSEIVELVSLTDEKEVKSRARKLFGELSAGHRVVLLTITRLVETVAERSLVLIDEPESHLHPPLLSAFIRALSDLLADRNGVAIIATHSPVVLQEVPRSCVWKIRRSGSKIEAERPEIETFGENVGILTREVFGLEVTHSGFHSMLKEAVAEHGNFDAVLEHFNNELGGEARAIVRALIAAGRTREDP
jgi:AAA domain, putative AbiEii toxin, Type IV TA system